MFNVLKERNENTIFELAYYVKCEINRDRDGRE